jgi:hypothetical protein
MGGEIACIKEETTNVYIILARKPKRNRHLERLRSKRKDNIKIDVSETVFGVDWIHVAQNMAQKHKSRYLLAYKN